MQEIPMPGGLTKPNRRDKSALADAQEMDAALHGDLGAILELAGSGRGKGATDALKSGMSVSVVAGAGFEPATSRL